MATQFKYTGGLINRLIFPQHTWEERAPLGVQFLFLAMTHTSVVYPVETT